MLLEPKKGTQGREMNRQIKIALALVLTGMLYASAPLVASAASGPLLSGYGGPGAGEQAIIGATLLNGGGGASSGGPASSRGSNGPAHESAAGSSNGAGTSGSSSGGSRGARRAGGASRSPSSNTTIPTNRSQARGARTYVYPNGASTAQRASSVIGISSGDVLPLIGIVATLALVAVLTVRFARLQP